MLAALGLGLLLAGAVAAVYTVIAWRLGRRRGRNGLLLGWAAATTALTTLAALSAIRNLAVIRPVAARDVLSFFGLYLLVFGAGLGGVTWVVSRRLARFPLPTAGQVRSLSVREASLSRCCFSAFPSSSGMRRGCSELDHSLTTARSS